MAENETENKRPPTEAEKLARAQSKIADQARELEELKAKIAGGGTAHADNANRNELDRLNAELKNTRKQLDAVLAGKPAEGLNLEQRYIALVRISGCEIERVPGPNGRMIETRGREIEIRRNEPLPFDPKHPPRGFEGLIEGQQYERRQVLVQSAA